MSAPGRDSRSVAADEAESAAAIRTLRSIGYTYHYGEMWKPPLGPSASPLLDRIAELEAQLAEADALIAAQRYTIDAEREALEQRDYEQWKAKKDADEFCHMKALLNEWVLWYAAQRHVGPTTAHAIIRGEAEWPNAPPSEQSLPARTIALLASPQ